MTTPDGVPDAARAQIKESFIAERGYWRPWTETMLQVCPAFVQQYARYAGYPARTGPLTERMVELIYVALDSSSSHLFEPGLHTHMKRALEVGATQADIFDVLHLVAVQGLASVCQATDILAELADLSAAAIDERSRPASTGSVPRTRWPWPPSRGSTPATPTCFWTLSNKLAPVRA